MRKIVWFDYHKNYGGTWLICLLTCIAFFLQQKMKYPYLSVIAVLVSNLFLRNKGESQIPYIPQTVFLVPTSLEIRKGYVKRKFCLRIVAIDMLTLSSFLALICVYIFSDLYSAF